MKITWLGQAGLLFETEGKMILIDPYFSNSVSIKDPEKYRRVKIKNEYLNLSPDVVICTHDHLDHTDLETLRNYFTYNSQITGLAPFSAWNKLKKFGGEKNNYVLFNEGTEWTEKGITFYAVHAEHSDKYGIGIVFTAEKKSYYITGDTLYNKKIFESLPDFKFYMTFLPINGMGIFLFNNF